MSQAKNRIISLADQIVFSLANFILTVTLVRYYSETEFAGYVVALSIALMIQGVQRSCYVVQNAILPQVLVRVRTSKILGQHLVVCGGLFLLEAIIVAFVFMITDDVYIRSIAISTLVCSLIYAQLEFDRMMFVKHDRYGRAFLTSLVFLLLVGALFLFSLYGHISFFECMLVIGSYSLFKAAFLVYTFGVPDFFWGWRLARRDFKRFFTGSVIGTAGYSGYNHFPVFILGMFAPPLQSAVFGAMRGLMQPLQIVAKSLDIVDKNIFHSKLEQHGNLRAVLLRQLTIYAGFAVIVMLGTVFFGSFIVHLIYGEKYAAYSGILIGWAAIFGMLAITLPVETIIVKTGKMNQYNGMRLIAGILGLSMAYALRDYGAAGAVVACLAGWVCALVLTFALLWPDLKKVDKAL